MTRRVERDEQIDSGSLTTYILSKLGRLIYSLPTLALHTSTDHATRVTDCHAVDSGEIVRGAEIGGRERLRIRGRYKKGCETSQRRHYS